MPRHSAALAAVASLALAAGLLACSDDGVVASSPELALPSARYDFGDVPVLNERVVQVELQNVGRAPLTVDSAALAEEGTAFAIRKSPATVEGASSGFVEVLFKPERLGDFSATLVVRSDDEALPEARIALAGRGSTAARLEVDASVELPRTCEGAESVGKLTLRSTGTADLVIERIAFAEGSAPELQFASSTRAPVTVARGEELRLTLRYQPGPGAPEVSTGAVVLETTDPDRRRVEVPVSGRVNRSPAATIQASGVAAPGARITLDGSGTLDPDGDSPLTFAWALRSSPIGSSAKVSPAEGPTSALVLDLPGAYSVQLLARDAAGCLSQPAFAEVLARPAQQLLVEVVWNNRDADLDLHLAPGSSAFFGPRDCYYADGHRQPDWGTLGDPADDPQLTRDALTGWGPEIIEYARPAEGSYRVMVHYFNDHRSKTPATDATLRVYVFGVVRAEVTRRLSAEGQQWTALSVDWPSGTVTPIDEVR